MRRRWLLVAVEIAFPLALLAVIWVWTQSADQYYYPPLGDVFTAFADTWLFERVSSDVLPSLGRLAGGYLAAIAVGVPLGMVLGQSRVLRRATYPLVEFLRAIPAPAMIPFTILVLGVGDASKIFVIALVCLWPILLNAIDGVSGIEPTLHETSRVYRIGRWQRQRHVVLPAALPQIFAGMRTSLALALILMVITEMVASSSGIGFFVLDAQRSFAITEMWSGIVLLGLLGYALNAVFLVVERRVLAWHRGARAGAT